MTRLRRWTQARRDARAFRRVKASWPEVMVLWGETFGIPSRRERFSVAVPTGLEGGVLLVDCGSDAADNALDSRDVRLALSLVVERVTGLRLEVQSSSLVRRFTWTPGQDVSTYINGTFGDLTEECLSPAGRARLDQMDPEERADWERSARAFAHPRLIGSEANLAVEGCLRWVMLHPCASQEWRRQQWGEIVDVCCKE